MSNETLGQGSFMTGAYTLPRARKVRLAMSSVSAKLPRLLRPGLARESFCLAAVVKNRYEFLRGHYFRDRAPLAVTFRNGVRWESTRRDSLVFLLEEIVANRCYTPRWFYSPGLEDVVIDVGANIGVFAAHICGLSSGAKVACFEPDPVSYRTLVGNVAANNLSARVQTHDAAVWREQGVLYLAPGSSGCSVLQRTVPHADNGTTAVKCISLAEALRTADPSGGDIALLKIDTEGAETEILEGADPASMHRVRRVALEYHSAEKRIRCQEILRRHGFILRLGSGDASAGIWLAYRTL